MTNHQLSFLCDITEMLYTLSQMLSSAFVTKSSQKWLKIVLFLLPILMKYLTKICDDNKKKPTTI